ncbi:MAG: TonB-dependent receptor, partial [Chitinophagales bacterium]|nr:TonB-dependent receptor [Chitinophagales bacterium]
VSKQGDTSRPFGFETYNTIGSYNLLSTYNAISGKIGKTKYYAYFSKRSRDGYRKNEHTDYDAEGIALTYEHSEKLSLRFEWARSNYTYRLPGPLTDSMFYADPTQASRGRNYFNPAINIPSFTLKWDIQKNTRIQYVSSAVIGVRNSILFDKPANNYDTLLASTREYAYRQIDIDRFNSFTHELRLLQGYSLGQNQSHLSLGLQFMHNELHRTQVGKGSTGSDFNLNLVDPIWGRDMYFNTKNLALFAENNFSVLKNLSINIGARVEMGESNMKGKIIYYPENAIPVSIAHRFPLFGTSIDYKPTEQINLYGGFSQSYRPMLFKDIVPGSLFEKIDPNIRDADGYNAELGFRGKFLFLQWDITGFLLQYNNRFGTLALTDSLGNFYTYKTNIGNSLTKGLEIFLQANWTLPYKNQISIFTSTSIMDGRYSDGKLKLGNTNVDISGNKIESVPDIISRNGMTYQYSKLSITLLYSYTSSTYADALNTALPNPSGSVGLVPSYGIVDMNLTYRVSKSLEFKTSINNLTNEQYFTKRPMFYPGPGVWSSDGANGSFSIILRL